MIIKEKINMNNIQHSLIQELLKNHQQRSH